jgi:hypothetical protein
MKSTGKSIKICGLKVNTAKIPQIIVFIEERIRQKDHLDNSS